MLKGTLDDFSLPDLFRLMSLAKKSGRLDVERKAGNGKVFFREGEVYYAESSLSKEPLGQKLIRAGVLTEGSLRKALDQSASTGERVGEILVSSGMVTLEQIETAIRQQIEDSVFDLLRWELGEFLWEPGVGADIEIPISVSVENLIMEASRRLDELEVIKRKIPSMEAILAMAPKPPEGALEINITPEEWRVLVMVDGSKSLNEIAAIAGLDEFGAMRTMYGLASAGLIEVVDSGLDDEELEGERVDWESHEAEATTAPDAELAAEVAEAEEEPAALAFTPRDEVSTEPELDAEPDAVPVLEAEPVVEVEPEPEPVMEAEPEPVVEVEPEPEPVLEAEPVLEVEPVVEVEPEPVLEAEPEPVVELEPEPVVLDELEIVAAETSTAVDEWFQDPDVPVESFDAPAPDELVTEVPEPDSVSAVEADPFLGSFASDDDAAADEVIEAESPPPAPEPTAAPVADAQPPSVDRAAVVRELAGLFDDERPNQRPAPSAPRPEGTPVAERSAPAAEGDQRKRVEDDDQVNKGLISRLIDGVKGL